MPYTEDNNRTQVLSRIPVEYAMYFREVVALSLEAADRLDNFETRLNRDMLEEVAAPTEQDWEALDREVS